MTSNKLSELDLKVAVGRCSWNLIYCHNCPSTPADRWDKPFPDKGWCIKLNCSKCNSIWYVCSTCTKLRNRMIKFQQLSRHQRQYHKDDALCNLEPSTDANSSASIMDIPHLPDKSMFNTLGNSHSIQYFLEHQYSSNARKNLIAKSVGILDNAHLLDDDDVEMLFSLTNLMSRLSRIESLLLSDVLKKVVNCTRRQYCLEIQSNSMKQAKKKFP